MHNKKKHNIQRLNICMSCECVQLSLQDKKALRKLPLVLVNNEVFKGPNALITTSKLPLQRIPIYGLITK